MSDYYLDKVYEVNPVDNSVVRTLNVPAGDVEHFTHVKAHGVAIDNSLNEIYVSTQGHEVKNAGINVLDKNAGEFKRFIWYGVNPTDMILDEEHDLIYLADFGTIHAAEPSGGTVAVIDARTGTVVKEVKVASAKINHLNLLPDSSVVVLDKAGDHKNTEVDFHIDEVTGQFEPSAVDVHSGTSTTIDTDSLTKISVKDAGTEQGTVRERPAKTPLGTVKSEDGATVGARCTC